MKRILLSLLATLAFSMSAYAAVNLNTATQAELESLEGVGPVKAQAIIDYRKKNGGFKNVDELDNVPGFGDATMKNLKGQVSVSGKTTMSQPIAKPEAKKETASSKTDKASKSAKDEKTAKKEEKIEGKIENKSIKTDTKDVKKDKKDSKTEASAKTEKKATTETKKAEKSASVEKKSTGKKEGSDKKTDKADKKEKKTDKKDAKAKTE